MGNAADVVVKQINATLDGIEKHPGMYGFHLETIELTALLLMELRAVALHPEDPEVTIQGVRSAWVVYLRGRGLDVNNGYLSGLLEDLDDKDICTQRETIAAELAGFRKTLA